MKSLKARSSDYVDPSFQLNVLNQYELPKFGAKIKEDSLLPLKPTGLEILQINVGYMCNQTCSHCHVDAGPDRKEIMTKETMQYCLNALEKSDIHTVDLTGGAPEMNPNFRWFVEEITKRGAKVIVRCNLTIIRANPKYHDLPLFFREHNVEVVSSLPCYTAGNTDAQRGDGVFAKSIKALQMLNEVGYGKPGTGLTLNLVYNPGGAYLSPEQDGLEKDYKKQLKEDFGIEFNSLFAINNIPISRFLEYLDKADKLEEYMETLVNAYNPVAAKNVMCRNLISVGWDGRSFDCDFNQMLDMELAGKAPKHIKDFHLENILGEELFAPISIALAVQPEVDPAVAAPLLRGVGASTFFLIAAQ